MADHLKELDLALVAAEATFHKYFECNSIGIALDTKALASKKIRDGFNSIRFRIHISNHILEVINDFDWSKIHKFEEMKKDNKGGPVTQRLCGDGLLIGALYPMEMEWFVFTYVCAYFSYLYGIVDNFASMTILLFNLKIDPKSRYSDILKIVPVPEFSRHFEEKLIKNADFMLIRKIRREIQHNDVRQTFQYDKGEPTYLGSGRPDIGPAFLTDTVHKPDVKMGGRIDVICKQVFGGCCASTEAFLAAISPSLILPQAK